MSDRVDDDELFAMLRREEFAQQEARVGEAAAVFAFISWLTTQPKIITLSENHDSSEVAALADEYCQSQGWEITDDRWYEKLKPAPRR